MVPERLGEFSFLLDNGRQQLIEDLPNLARGSVEVDLDTCVNTLVKSRVSRCLRRSHHPGHCRLRRAGGSHYRYWFAANAFRVRRRAIGRAPSF